MRQAIFFFTTGSIILLSAAGLFVVGKKVAVVQTDINRYEELLAKEYRVEIVIEESSDEDDGSLPVQDDAADTTSTEPTPIEEEPDVIAALPPSVDLNVPFTSQAPEGNWDQPWQDACEEAAVLMLDGFYKGYGVSPLFAKDEIIKMVAWEEEKGWGGSIEIEKVSQLLDFYMGDNSHRLIEQPTVEDIKRSLAEGHPVLVVAAGKKLPNPYFSGDGPEYHALIVRGYTEDSFITNDPGTRNGEAFEYRYDDLMAAIADWNGGDVNNGRSVVLTPQ